jgi:hypothetical protein
MNIGGIVFGAVCLFLVFSGVMYVVAVNGNQSQFTDTYGSTLDSASNTSQGLVANATATQGPQIGIPLLIIVAAIIVCVVLFIIYLGAKLFFH